jgi:glycine betaine/proline transport system ATP-binding protein
MSQPSIGAAGRVRPLPAQELRYYDLIETITAIPGPADAAEALIRVEHLYKVFGPRTEDAMRLISEGKSKDEVFEQTGSTVAVHDANFEVRAGEIFVVMGLSGSGKSTLLRLINRLIEPTQGAIRIHDVDIASLAQRELIDLRRRETAMVFQSFALLPHLTVLDNAAFGLDVAGISNSERDRRAMAALEQVGLAANAKSFPDELSGGMRQRVGLARALATDPSILLMDEAFSALDPLIRTEMQNQLLALQKQTPRTVLFVSHDLDEAMHIGDRIAIMEGGRVLQTGTAEEILENPKDEYVRSFFGGVDVSNVYQARNIASREPATILSQPIASAHTALQRLQDQDHEYGYVESRDGRFLGIVSTQSLQRVSHLSSVDLSSSFLPIEPAPANTSVEDLIDRLTQSPVPLPIVDERGRFLGIVSKTGLLETLHRRQGVD